jgi:hypothetical protein
MAKILPLITLLLAGAATSVFSQSKPFTLESRGDWTEFTAVTPNGSVFQFEDNKRDGTVDKAKEWPADEQVASVYEGDKVTAAQQKFFDDMTKGYTQQQANNFVNEFKRAPSALEFYNPFGTAARTGRAILYSNDIEYKVSEGPDGLSFSVRIPSKKGEKEISYVNIENLSSGSLYSVIKALTDNLTAERDKLVQKDYNELSGLLSASTSK